MGQLTQKETMCMSSLPAMFLHPQCGLCFHSSLSLSLLPSLLPIFPPLPLFFITITFLRIIDTQQTFIALNRSIKMSPEWETFCWSLITGPGSGPRFISSHLGYWLHSTRPPPDTICVQLKFPCQNRTVAKGVTKMWIYTSTRRACNSLRDWKAK